MKGKKDNGSSAKKPIYKKWWFWVIIVVLLSAIIGNMGSSDNTTPDTTQNPEQSEPVDNAQLVGDSTDKFVEEVKTAIQGAISSKTESIQDVVLKDGDLCVIVDLSNANPEPLTIGDLAWSRASSITEAILNIPTYETYEDLWNTISVDFGTDIGKVTCGKDDVETNGFGRYFPPEGNFDSLIGLE